MCREFCRVGDWVEWRKQSNKKSKSVEAAHEDLAKALKWERTDVLYSFLGIYTIGLLAFYPAKFHLSGCMIKCVDPKRRAVSFRFLSETYANYPALNELPELKEFLKRYQRLGNLCPIWPGGNRDKGCSWVYDLPSFYFKMYPRWTSFLLAEYPEAHLEAALTLKNGETIESFLKQMSGPYQDNKNKYCAFLSHICSVIDEREKAILAFAEEQGIDISQYKHPEKEF